MEARRPDPRRTGPDQIRDKSNIDTIHLEQVCRYCYGNKYEIILEMKANIYTSKNSKTLY